MSDSNFRCESQRERSILVMSGTVIKIARLRFRKDLDDLSAENDSYGESRRPASTLDFNMYRNAASAMPMSFTVRIWQRVAGEILCSPSTALVVRPQTSGTPGR